jgi:hypothetical protein
VHSEAIGTATHNVTRLDPWPVIHRRVLVEPLHKHLTHDLDTRVHPPTAHVAEHGSPLPSRLDGRARAVRSGRHADLGAERGFVGRKRVECFLGADDEDAVVHVDAD